MNSQLLLPCHACGERRKLVRAHIVPESFCKRLTRNGKPAKLVAIDDYVKRSHTGIYDETILCELCEQRFSQPDDYAQELLIQSEDRIKKFVHGSEHITWEIPEYNHVLLHTFLLGVLWRASVSSHAFFDKVDLGPHGPRIKEIALGYSTAMPGEYPFIAGRLIHSSTGNLMFPPIRQKIGGVTLWYIDLGDWHFWVKVDKGRRSPDGFREMEARPGAPLVAVCRNLVGSPEHKGAMLLASLFKQGKLRPNA